MPISHEGGVLNPLDNMETTRTVTITGANHRVKTDRRNPSKSTGYPRRGTPRGRNGHTGVPRNERSVGRRKTGTQLKLGTLGKWLILEQEKCWTQMRIRMTGDCSSLLSF